MVDLAIACLMFSTLLCMALPLTLNSLFFKFVEYDIGRRFVWLPAFVLLVAKLWA